MKEYKITDEQILRMAEKCPSAKEVLRVGFPRVFEEQEEEVNELLIKMKKNDKFGFGIKGVSECCEPIWLLIPNKNAWVWNDETIAIGGFSYRITEDGLIRRKL